MRRLLVPLLLVGCATHGYSFRTDRTTYRPGDAIDVMLENHGDRDIGYNLCDATLERRDGQRWQAEQYWVPLKSSRDAVARRAPVGSFACLANLRTLRPWGRTHAIVGLDDRADSGEYRLRVRIEWQRRVLLWLIHYGAWGGGDEIVTPTFTVEGR